MGDDWVTVWVELRDGLTRRPRCSDHPEYPFVETLGRPVVNDIVSAEESGITVRSHGTGKDDFIGAERFRKWWDHLLRVGSASLRTTDPNNPDPWRSSVVGAILAAALPSRLQPDSADPMTLWLFHRARESNRVTELLREGTQAPVESVPRTRPRRPTRPVDTLPCPAPTPAPPPVQPHVPHAAGVRDGRLQTLKLVLEIGVVAVTLIGGIIALVWRSR